MTLLSRNSLLLLIDLQKAIDDPRWGDRNNPQAEVNIVQLLAAWRQSQMPVLHVKHMSTEPDSPYRPGQTGNEFRPATAPLPEEEILEKEVHSAFIRTGLEAKLRSRGIAEIVITGVVTNNSVEATARMASDLGFTTLVVADATFTFGRADFDGTWHLAAAVHAMSLANLSGEYATILSTEEILQQLPLLA
ncbi:MAG: cysteine hydrolase [Leptolyngbya sp. SIO4C5]|nr:cysteine hydrolase [Leptolyngbya sp. SIO4C5]